jgi:NADH-quinone oxidoreductase subunit I
MKLSNRTKVLEQEELTLAERIYLPAIAGGMLTTLKHFFQKPVTIRYPEQKRYLVLCFVGTIS